MKMNYIKIESYDELLKYDGQTVFTRNGNKYSPSTVGCINDDRGSVKGSEFLYLGGDTLDGGHPTIAEIMGVKYAYCITRSAFQHIDIYIKPENIRVDIGNEFLN